MLFIYICMLHVYITTALLKGGIKYVCMSEDFEFRARNNIVITYVFKLSSDCEQGSRR